MSISFPFTARTQENFLDVWNDRRNFLIGPELVSFTNNLPSAEEVIDILRKDPDSRVQFMNTADGDEKDALIETIQYRIENDEHLLINASVKDDLEDLIDKFLEDEYL